MFGDIKETVRSSSSGRLMELVFLLLFAGALVKFCTAAYGEHQEMEQIKHDMPGATIIEHTSGPDECYIVVKEGKQYIVMFDNKEMTVDSIK